MLSETGCQLQNNPPYPCMSASQALHCTGNKQSRALAGNGPSRLLNLQRPPISPLFAALRLPLAGRLCAAPHSGCWLRVRLPLIQLQHSWAVQGPLQAGHQSIEECTRREQGQRPCTACCSICSPRLAGQLRPDLHCSGSPCWYTVCAQLLGRTRWPEPSSTSHGTLGGLLLHGQAVLPMVKTAAACSAAAFRQHCGSRALQHLCPAHDSMLAGFPTDSQIDRRPVPCTALWPRLWLHLCHGRVPAQQHTHKRPLVFQKRNAPEVRRMHICASQSCNTP